MEQQHSTIFSLTTKEYINGAVLQRYGNLYNIVEVIKVGDTEMIRKYHLCAREALIQEQLKDVQVNRLPTVPKIYSSHKDSNYYVTYMEKLLGSSLLDALPSISDDILLHTLAVIHHILQELKSNTGLVHGDLHLENIFLRDYGMGRKYHYTINVGGSEVIVELPYAPMLIDLEHSSTHLYPYCGDTLSSADFYDIKIMYYALLEWYMDHERSPPVLVSSAAANLKNVVTHDDPTIQDRYSSHAILITQCMFS